jgi:ubiquinone/menaquinone biosynthesis C-methylase UbiE
MPAKDSTQRFSSRLDNYVRYRPGYPSEILDLLKTECGLKASSILADIASGTGILTRMLLENGNRVVAVEPNFEMRQAGEQLLARYQGFTSVGGSAEVTTLDDHSVDIITAAQSAHWFEREKARREFVRILVPGGWTMLLWNERNTDTTPLLREYEQLLLTYGTDYREVRHEHTTDAIDSFFAPSLFQAKVFHYSQELDAGALEGRLLSSSYTPQPEDANYESMLRELRSIFDRYQHNGRVSFEYTTRVYYGRLE